MSRASFEANRDHLFIAKSKVMVGVKILENKRQKDD